MITNNELMIALGCSITLFMYMLPGFNCVPPYFGAKRCLLTVLTTYSVMLLIVVAFGN